MQGEKKNRKLLDSNRRTMTAKDFKNLENNTETIYDEIVKHEQEKDFNETLWICGQKIGTIKGSFIMVNLPFLT